MLILFRFVATFRQDSKNYLMALFYCKSTSLWNACLKDRHSLVCYFRDSITVLVWNL